MAACARRLAVAATFLLVLLVLSYGAAHVLVRSEGFRSRLKSEIRQRTGYEVRFEELRLTPLLGIAASGVAAARDGKLLFEAAGVFCSLRPLDYYRGNISRLSLQTPVLYVSLPDLFKPSGAEPPKLSIGKLDIEDGRLVLGTGGGAPLVLRSIFLSGRNVSLAGETALQLRARLPAIDGEARLVFSGSSADARLDIAVSQGKDLPRPDEGRKALEARLQMSRKPDGGYEVDGSGAFDGFRLGAEAIDGVFQSRAEIDPQLDNVLFSAELKTPRLPVKLLPARIALAPGASRATLRGHYSIEQQALTLSALDVATAIGKLEGKGKLSFAAPARLEGAVRIRGLPLSAARSFLPAPLDGFSYAGDLAADLNLSGAYDAPVLQGTAWSGSAAVQGQRFSVSNLALKVPFEWARDSMQVKGASFRGRNLLYGRKGETQVRLGTASLAGGAAKRGEKPIEIEGDFAVSGGRFADAQESTIGEGLAASGRISYTERDGDPAFKGRVSVSRLELLRGKFFGDFGPQQPSFEFDANYHKKAMELRLDRLRVALASVGHVDVSGSVRRLFAGPDFDVRVKTDDLRHEGFYDFFVREAFKAAYPILAEIGLTGRSALVFRAQGSPESFTLEGSLHLRQSEIRARSGAWRVGPLALNLPLKIRYPEASKGASGDKPVAGSFSIRQVKTRSTSIPEIAGPIVLWNNELRFPQPIRLRLFGGAASIEGLTWKDAIGAPREAAFSLRLDGLRLLEVTESLGWHPFGGTLSGSIPRVRWTENSLRSDGVITLEAFGGRAAIRAMAIENPFSPARSIRMDAELHEINLEQASETFEFGRVSGILAGTIKDLVVAHGQPAEFTADIRTVDRPGVDQWISVEALNKITVLSSGAEAGAVYGGLAAFFDFFRYSKLGFKAALKNDKLVLRGVESKDGKEYLVVGTFLPPTVNIISHTQEIGFSELLRRLERIQRDGGRASALP